MSSIHKLLHVVDLVKDLDLNILAKRDNLLTTQFAFNLISIWDIAKPRSPIEYYSILWGGHVPKLSAARACCIPSDGHSLAAGRSISLHDLRI